MQLQKDCITLNRQDVFAGQLYATAGPLNGSGNSFAYINETVKIYLLGKQPARQGREYLTGIDTGYVLSVVHGNWRRAGSGGIVQDMPETRPGNFYFYLTFSGFLMRCP